MLFRVLTCENEESDHEAEHDEEVDPLEPGGVTQHAQHTEESDDEDDDADDKDGSLEELDALTAPAPAKRKRIGYESVS